MKFYQKLKSILDELLSTRKITNCIFFFLLASLSAVLPGDKSKTHTETIQKTAHFKNPSQNKNELNVHNIHGNVKVKQHSSEEVEIKAEKRICANHSNDLSKGIEEMRLVIEELDDLILVYLDAPFIKHVHRDTGFSYNMNINRNKIGYDFHFNITIKVPANTNVNASTINKGDVEIEGIEALEISAANVNGNIELTEISGKTKATTVNGNIIASYTQNPDTDSSYKTVNGSIEVYYPGTLSANIYFDSLRGDLYTDFEKIRRSAPEAEMNVSRSANGTRYKINNSAPYHIGNGGPDLSFKVLNGDVFIKKSII